MAARKLQGEIDRVLKQIAEHLQEFDQIWQKVHSAPTPNLKEKYEGDLKKEIKKLQRFRDQLKSWAANSDIKNKKPLLDARKSIETEMERFKVLEKETKTKAYSKEGLSSAKRGGRHRSGSGGSDGGDPREDPAKRDTFAWLDELEEQLQEQLTELEEKLETLKASSKKKKSAAVDTQVDDLSSKQARHQHHVERLQAIKDRLEHDELAIALVEDIKDDVEYYVHSNAEADFQEDETLYDALELDKDVGGSRPESDEEGGGGDDDAQAEDDATGSAAEHEEDEAGEDEAAEEDGEDAGDDEDGAPAGTVASILRGAGAKATPTKAKAASAAAAAGKAGAKSTPASSPASAGSKGRNASTAAAAAGPAPVVPSPSAAAAAATGSGKQDTLANIVMKNQKQAAAAAAASTPAAAPTVPSPASSTTPADKRGASAAATAAAAKTGAAAAAAESDKKQSAAIGAGASTPKSAAATVSASMFGGLPKTATPGAMPSIAPAQLGRMPPPGTSKLPGSTMMPPPGLTSQTPPPPGLGPGLAGTTSAAGATGPSSSGSSHSASSEEQASSSGPRPLAERGPVPDEYLLQLQLLEPSLRHLPDPGDSERPRSYLPRNPYRTPSYFPSLPAPIFDDPILFEQLSVDTLFFIFYFQQGTPHQYLAARELKKQSWRYHKNFLTWFQRHDDPKLTTDDFEQGTYVYFDYESGWIQRIKADFTFEYRHLEDELQVPVPNNI